MGFLKCKVSLMLVVSETALAQRSFLVSCASEIKLALILPWSLLGSSLAFSTLYSQLQTFHLSRPLPHLTRRVLGRGQRHLGHEFPPFLLQLSNSVSCRFTSRCLHLKEQLCSLMIIFEFVIWFCRQS